MKLLAIKNNGLICKEDLFLIGSSTKRDDDTKIGMFGSGWKYALAWLLRNECDIQIFSGNEVINVSTVETKHRDRTVNVITIDGVATSLTTEMGPEWTAWMAIREVVSNAIDEGGFEYELDASISKTDDTTTVYIAANDEVIEMFENFDNYFAFNREDGIKTTLDYGDGTTTIYFKDKLTPLVIYRKGIRCYNNTEKLMTRFDINISDININESRLCELYYAKCSIGSTFENTDNYDLFKTILYNLESLDIDVDISKKLIKHFTNIIAEGVELGTNISGLLESNIGKVIIPNDLYNSLAKRGIVKSIFDIIDDNDAPAGFKYTDHNIDLDGIKQVLLKFNISNVEFHIGAFHLNRYREIQVSDNKVYLNTLKDSYFKNNSVDELAYLILAKASSKLFAAQFVSAPII